MMRKKLWIGLLTIGMLVQSISVPVQAAPADAGMTEWAVGTSAELSAGAYEAGADGTVKEEPGDGKEEYPDEADGTKTGGAAGENPDGADENKPDGTTGENSDGAGGSKPDGAAGGSPDEADEDKPDDAAGNPDGSDEGNAGDGTAEGPGDVAEGKPGEATDGDADGTDIETPDDMEETPGESDETSEEEQGSISANQLDEANELQEELRTEYVSGGGLYQEGAFDVVAEWSEQEGALIRPMADSDSLAEAEEYLYQQMLEKKTSINVSAYKIPTSVIKDLLLGVINDHPDLYFAASTFGYTISGGNVIQVTPTYLSGLDDALFQSGLREALASVTPDMTDIEKAITLHDYIVVNCEYGYADSSSTVTAHSAYGALAERKAVCQGYALAYKLLLNKVGIECYMVTSNAMNHAWNLVVLDGEYYQIDVTWDDPLPDSFGLARHSYMFVSDAEFKANRGHSDWIVTRGTSAVNYVATDTQYDNAFWLNVNAPIVFADHDCYYIYYTDASAGLMKGTLTGDARETIVSAAEIGKWGVVGRPGMYYVGIYSGLFLLGDRLYYNTSEKICSVPLGGGEVREETDILPTSGNYVFGSAYCQGEVQYIERSSPSQQISPGTIQTAELNYKPTISVRGITLDREEAELNRGESIKLSAAIYPANADSQEITWTSSDPSVATVTNEASMAEDGKSCTVTAVGGGSCTITASVGKYSAACSVTVIVPVYQVTFVGFNGKTILTQSVNGEEDAEPPTVTAPTGYQFIGWAGDYTNIQQDTVITAQYQAVEYQIDYVLNGGTNEQANPDAYTIESEIELRDAGGREGYIFTGWYRGENCEGDPIAVIEQGSFGDLTLYAGWRVERELWFRVDGAEDDNVIPNQVYTGSAIKPAVEVWYGEQPLKAGTDYTISYTNNKAANLMQTEAEQKKAPTVVVKGKGNYAGTIKETFVIEPKTIETDDFQINPLAAAYNGGKVIKPVPVVKWNGKKLTAKKDFTVTYLDKSGAEVGGYTDPGEYTIRVQGCGNYKGTREVMVTVADTANGSVLLGKVKIAKIPDQKYSDLGGEAVVFTQDMPKLTIGKDTLVLDEDYTLTYGECKEVGTYEVVITGKGNYVGVRRVSFKIVGDPIKTAKVAKLPSLVYTGAAQELSPNADAAENRLVITDKEGNELKIGEDYILGFSNNINVGTAKMTITGMGRYTGTVTKTFKITANTLTADNTDVYAELANAEQFYEKGGAKPKVKVTFKGTVLEEGVDYTLRYKNNTAVEPKKGVPTVTITGKKNFKGSRELTFTISQKTIADLDISAPDLEENAKAGKYMSVPVLTDLNGKKLKAGTDYEKTYVYRDENGTVLDKEDRPQAGSMLTVTVTGKGNYTGENTTTFRIIAKGMNISKAKVKVNSTFYYTGRNVTLSKNDLAVTLGKTTLANSDYQIVGYSNNLKKGTAKVTIKGNGVYGGTKQISFRILSQNMKWWEKIFG